MTLVVFPHQGFIVIGIAIAAEMRACIISADIGSKKTGTAFPRCFAAWYGKFFTKCFFEDSLGQTAIRINIVPLQDGRFTAQMDGEPRFLAISEKALTRSTLVMGADGTGFWKIALCFFIKIDEANDHLVCIALKRFCHGAKGFDMVCRRVGMIDENGVITPDDAICAYLMGQVLERRKNVPLLGTLGSMSLP